MTTLTINHIRLNPGIVELLYQLGYHYFVRYEISASKSEIAKFDVSFYKTKETAQKIYSLIDVSNKYLGHVIDDEAVEMANGVLFCEFWIRDVRY